MYLGKTTTTAKTIVEEVEPDEVDTDSDENSNNFSIPITLPESAPHSPAQSSLSTTNLRSTGNLDSFVDTIHQSEEDKVWELLARACYASNTPLNFTENDHLKWLLDQFILPQIYLTLSIWVKT